MYMAGLGQSVQYYRNGQPSVTAKVGDLITFDAPGFSEAWLEVSQNGKSTFSGPHAIPMPPYQLLPRDIGFFQTAAYQLTTGRTRGALIGATSISVEGLPASPTIPTSTGFQPLPPAAPPVTTPPYVPPTIIPGPGGVYETPELPPVETAGFDMTGALPYLLLGGVALVFFMQRKGGR